MRLKLPSLRSLLPWVSAAFIILGWPVARAETHSPESSGSPPSGGNSSKIVYAHYMHCYVLGYYRADNPALDKAMIGSWDLDHFPHQDDSYRQFWSKDLAPLCRGGDAALQKDFDLGQLAGLDAFGLLINHGALIHTVFSQGQDAMFRLAERNPIKILPEIWEGQPKGQSSEENEQQLIAFGNNLKALMDKYPDSYVVIQGKPALVLPQLTSQNCQAMRPFFNAWGGPDKFFIIAYDPINYLKPKMKEIISLPKEHTIAGAAGCTVSGVSAWSPANSFGNMMNSTLPYIAKAKKIALDWPVPLPFYQVRPDFKPGGPQWAAESFGAAKFIDEWIYAIQHDSMMVDLQTWNDFSETTLTETNHSGKSFIDLNRYFSDWLHNGTPPQPEKDQLWLFYHHQLVNADIDGMRSSDPEHRNETPLTDYLEVVSFLTSPGKLDLQDGDKHYSLEAPEGFHDWVLYGTPSVERAAKIGLQHGEVQTNPYAHSHPVNNSYRTAQQIAAVVPSLPVVSLSRGGVVSLKLTGRASIQGKAKFEDLAVVATEAIEP
jgi:hypothetical protein